MKRYFFQPKRELKNILKHIEILDVSNVTALGIGSRFLPDGFFEIGFNLGSDDLKITSTSVSDIQLDNPYGYFFGQCNVSSQMFSKGRLHIMIVKIYPWAASLLFDFDLSDCIDLNLKLDDVLGKEVKFLEEKISEVPGRETKVEILQSYLITKLARRNNSVNHTLKEATNILLQTKGIIKMNELASFVNSSPRTIQRIFRQYYGITPKQYSRQMRLRNFASKLSRSNNLSLTELAIQCGYFDQAHFNHEFKSIAKITPSEFFMSGTPLVDDFLK